MLNCLLPPSSWRKLTEQDNIPGDCKLHLLFIDTISGEQPVILTKTYTHGRDSLSHICQPVLVSYLQDAEQGSRSSSPDSPCCSPLSGPNRSLAMFELRQPWNSTQVVLPLNLSLSQIPQNAWKGLSAYSLRMGFLKNFFVFSIGVISVTWVVFRKTLKWMKERKGDR